MDTKFLQLRIKHLALLDAIATSGSLHAAAKVLHLTQPALTNMLQEVESIFGAQLFVRNKKGLTANSVGSALIWRARLILNELSRAGGEVTEILNGRREITIGLTPMMMLEVVPKALGAINNSMPNLRIVFVERNVPTLLDELAQGKIDIVLGSLPYDASVVHEKAAFEYIRLFEEKLCVMARDGHALAQKKRVNWTDLTEAAWVLPTDGSLTRRNFNKGFIQHDISPPEPKYVSSSFHSNVRIISHTDCLMVAPLSVGKHYTSIGLVKVLNISFPKADNPISIILKKTRIRTETENKIISIFLEYFSLSGNYGGGDP